MTYVAAIGALAFILGTIALVGANQVATARRERALNDLARLMEVETS